MVKKRADKETKRLYDQNEWANKDPSALTQNWQGRIAVLNADKSFIAKKLGITENGEYAIKVR